MTRQQLPAALLASFIDLWDGTRAPREDEGWFGSRNRRTEQSARSCPEAGRSSGPLHGSVATAVLPSISSKPSPRLPHGHSSLRTCSSTAAPQEHAINDNSFESESEGFLWAFAGVFRRTVNRYRPIRVGALALFSSSAYGHISNEGGTPVSSRG